MTIVHVASKPRNNLQKCVRCGLVILNGQQQAVKFYPEDTLIVQNGRDNIVVYDLAEASTVLCNAGEFSEQVFPS